MKRLYLIRHGEAALSGEGRGDHGRRLTDAGRAEARHLGHQLADAGIQVVLASDAERAAATASGLGLDARVDARDDLYNASTEALLAALAELPDDVEVAALVAHAPGVPHLVEELAGPDADAAASEVVSVFDTATAAGIECDGTWSDLGRTRLFWAGRGEAQHGRE